MRTVLRQPALMLLAVLATAASVAPLLAALWDWRMNPLSTDVYASAPPGAVGDVGPAQIELTDFRARPIFHIDRRERRIAPLPIAEPQTGLEGVVVVGMVEGAGGARWVYLRLPGVGETVKLGLGELYAGWTLTGVSESALEFTRDDQILGMEFDNGGMGMVPRGAKIHMQMHPRE